MFVRPSAVAVAFWLFAQLISPNALSAQAWLPGKGVGRVSIAYKNLYIKDHSDVTARKLDRGRIRSNVVSADVDYGVSRRWAVNLSVPLTVMKYSGRFPHTDPDHANLDDGNYQGAFQDFRFGVRYGLVRYSPVVVTPFVEGVLPSHDYETFAHAAIGRNLRELLVGTNVGWQGENSFLSNVNVQARVSYGFVERVLGRSHNRTNFDTQFSYFLTPRLALSGLVSAAKHHGGLDWDSTRGTLQQWTLEEFLHHDELTRADMFDVGASLSFLLHGSTSVYATVLKNTWSRNAHPIHTGLVVGVIWGFHTRRPPPLSDEDEPLPPAGVVR